MNPAPRQPDHSTYSGRFAARLRELREKTGMTGQEMARKLIDGGLEITERTYYKWETGYSQPSLDTFPILAKALSTSPRNLLPKE